MIDSLFEILDVTHDGAISRSDLHLAAKHMGWHWDSVLIPPCNGFREWVEGCIESGKNTLVIGGCTLNSCVRVSSIETLRYFKSKNLRIVVDLSICGARTRNFLPSPLYGGLSAVESAVHQMAAAGVQVVRRMKWKNN